MMSPPPNTVSVSTWPVLRMRGLYVVKRRLWFQWTREKTRRVVSALVVSESNKPVSPSSV